MSLKPNITPLAVPLARIHADHAWNARSGNYQESESDSDEGLGTLGIAESMAERGQDEPIDLRPHPMEHGQYLIIDGFRRFSAAEMLQKQGKQIKELPPAHILARIHQNISEADARLLNIAKGANRDNLKPADLAYGIGEALRIGKPLDEITRNIGKSKTYVHSLSQLVNPRKLNQKIFRRWREEGLPLTVNDLTLGVMRFPLDQQEAALKETLANAAPRAKNGKPVRGQGAWAQSASRHARELGWTLGRLVFMGVLPSSAANINWVVAVKACCKLGYKKRGGEGTNVAATPEQLEAFAKSAKEACEKALKGAKSWGVGGEEYERANDRANDEQDRGLRGTANE